MALPQAFEARMRTLLGTEYPAFQQALEQPQARGLRVNPLKIAPEEFVRRGYFALTPVPWAREGFFYTEPQRPGYHPLYEAGAYYIQEPSAMAVGALADARPGERILDLCAAPGGKTTHLAGRMAGCGLLVANEIHPTRASILAQSVERMGIPNCIVLNETPERLAQRFPDAFDAVVVDAPCSGEGMFRKDGNPAQDEWTPALPAFCAERQAAILHCAARLVRAGGRLVYSTCTFAPEENEGTLSRFLERHPEFEMVRMDAPEGLSPARPDWAENGNLTVSAAFRLWPHIAHGEGHFAAVLRKTDGERRAMPVLPRQTDKEQQAQLTQAQAMLSELTAALPEGQLWLHRDRLTLLPPACAIDTAGLRVRTRGIPLGTLRKNRLEPAHALSHALAPDAFCRVYNLSVDDPDCIRYLRGETLACGGAEKGWTAIAADGFVLGWGKYAGGIMKNHYPKGLRWVGK